MKKPMNDPLIRTIEMLTGNCQKSGRACHSGGVENSSAGSEIEYDLRIGIEKLGVVDQELTDIMKKGDSFAIYYNDLKDSTGNYVLSVEWLSN